MTHSSKFDKHFNKKKNFPYMPSFDEKHSGKNKLLKKLRICPKMIQKVQSVEGGGRGSEGGERMGLQ